MLNIFKEKCPVCKMKLEKGKLIEHKAEQKIIFLIKKLRLEEKYSYRQKSGFI